ncbi:MAG: PQQ-binding-like beta-propeller repeat protein [Phycisphaerae bacterium]|nr:PQQ-binding-like beta-propeller repeat protein [Phycisphaerae bacterium]
MRTLRIIAVTAVVFASCAALADWPWYNGPTHNAVAPAGKRLTSWPADGLKVLWTVKLGPGYAGPAIRDGKVYVLDRIPRTSEVLRCFNLADGKELWTFKYAAAGRFSMPGSRQVPTVDEKYVFCVGAMGHFHCLDRKTGKKIWGMHLLNDFDSKKPMWVVAQAPRLYKDWVIVSPLGKKAGVIACEKATGKIVWQSEPLGEMRYASPIITTLGGVEQVVIQSSAGSDTRVDGLDVTNGKVLWTYRDWQCRIPIPNTMPIGDGRMFISGGYNAGSAMFKVTRKADGTFETKTLFKTKKVNNHVHRPLLIDGHIYTRGNTNERNDGLLCMDLDGNLKWGTGRNPNFCKGNAILVDGLIYIIDGKTGFLHLVKPDPTGYKEISKFKVLKGGRAWGPMALSGNLLVIRDQTQMKCLDVGAK